MKCTPVKPELNSVDPFQFRFRHSDEYLTTDTGLPVEQTQRVVELRKSFSHLIDHRAAAERFKTDDHNDP